MRWPAALLQTGCLHPACQPREGQRVPGAAEACWAGLVQTPEQCWRPLQPWPSLLRIRGTKVWHNCLACNVFSVFSYTF